MQRLIVCAVACSALLMQGCGTAPSAPVSPVVHAQTVEIKVQVPVPCIDTLPVGPVFLSDTELLAAPNGSAVDRIWRDHLQRQKWDAELTALLAACLAHPPQ